MRLGIEADRPKHDAELAHKRNDIQQGGITGKHGGTARLWSRVVVDAGRASETAGRHRGGGDCRTGCVQPGGPDAIDIVSQHLIIYTRLA